MPLTPGTPHPSSRAPLSFNDLPENSKADAMSGKSEGGKELQEKVEEAVKGKSTEEKARETVVQGGEQASS